MNYKRCLVDLVKLPATILVARDKERFVNRLGHVLLCSIAKDVSKVKLFSLPCK